MAFVYAVPLGAISSHDRNKAVEVLVMVKKTDCQMEQVFGIIAL